MKEESQNPTKTAERSRHSTPISKEKIEKMCVDLHLRISERFKIVLSERDYEWIKINSVSAAEEISRLEG